MATLHVSINAPFTVRFFAPTVPTSNGHLRRASLNDLPAARQKFKPPMAMTPGGLGSYETTFKVRRDSDEDTDSNTTLTRNASAQSLHIRSAIESQSNDSDKDSLKVQPRSMAKPLPSQSIHDGGLQARDEDELEIRCSTPYRTPGMPARKTPDIPYTLYNYKLQTNPLRNAGLVAAVNSVVSSEHASQAIWIGTLGTPTNALSDDLKTDITDKLLQRNTVIVYLDDTEWTGHYEGFCKEIIWPLLHSQIPHLPKNKKYQDNTWAYYQKVNEAFAECIIKTYKAGDTVWIHDYHLMLVPELLRKKLPYAKVGLYMHSAFPPSEIFRNLPSRTELISGMLGANLIAFQTDDFRYQFLQTCTRLLNIETTDHGVVLEDGRYIDVFKIPMGIDSAMVNRNRELSEVGTQMQTLAERFAGKRVVVSRDKMDGIQGLKQKLRGYAHFLNKFPHWQGKVVLVQIVTSEAEDTELKNTINDGLASINKEWANIDYQPVVFLNQDIEYAQFLALLSIADCMLVTSLAGGMDLACHEFVACQDGALSAGKLYAPLVISEFIGAATVFGDSAILVNPWHPRGIALALNRALTMQPSEREMRWTRMFTLIHTLDARNWHKTFATSLEHAWKEHSARDPAFVPRFLVRDVRRKYVKSQKRLLLIDFEGTLTTWGSATESTITVPLNVLDLLRDLVEDDKNVVFIMSQHSKGSLIHMFRGLPKLGLIAENGAFIRMPLQNRFEPTSVVDTTSWLASVKNTVDMYAARIPKGFARELQSGITFFYNGADDKEAAGKLVGEMAAQINETCERLNVVAVPIDKGLVISSATINKAAAAKVIEDDLFEGDSAEFPDFVLVVGDFNDDECAFKWAQNLSDRVKAENIITCVVGERNTAASSMLMSIAAVISNLEKLALAATIGEA